VTLRIVRRPSADSRGHGPASKCSSKNGRANECSPLVRALLEQNFPQTFRPLPHTHHTPRSRQITHSDSESQANCETLPVICSKMSDAQPAAEAVSNNPADSVKVEDAAGAKPDVTTEATGNAQSGDKEAANGNSNAVKDEESSGARKDNYKRDRENNGRSNRGHGKFDRGNKRGGGRNFDRNPKRCALFSSLR